MAINPISTPRVDWEHGEHSGLVSIGTHRLFLSVYGPDRVPGSGSPIVIVMPGVAISILEWAAVRQLLQPTTRTLLYERAGLGLSDESPNPPTAANIALELDLLLKAADIRPPFVVVCHSYGGITSREFLNLKQIQAHEHGHDRQDAVVGAVFVDANQEKSYRLWPDTNITAMASGLDWYQVIGLDAERVLSDSEWQAVLDENASPRHQRTSDAEAAHYVESQMALGEKGQLEMKPPLLGQYHPISVLKGNATQDMQRVYDAGVEAGNGTPEQRLAAREKIAIHSEVDERLQRETLKLAAKHRFVHAKKSGHNVHITEPEAIVREVQWVLENLAN